MPQAIDHLLLSISTHGQECTEWPNTLLIFLDYMFQKSQISNVFFLDVRPKIKLKKLLFLDIALLISLSVFGFFDSKVRLGH